MAMKSLHHLSLDQWQANAFMNHLLYTTKRLQDFSIFTIKYHSQQCIFISL